MGSSCLEESDEEAVPFLQHAPSGSQVLPSPWHLPSHVFMLHDFDVFLQQALPCEHVPSAQAP
jgi:hypothetical protein